MPFGILSEKPNCYKVQDITNPSHVFSKKCQTKKQAEAQRIAIILNQKKKNPRMNMKKMFV